MVAEIQNRGRREPNTDAVKNALIKDGWIIIADPYFLQYEDAELYADLIVVKSLISRTRRTENSCRNQEFYQSFSHERF